MTLYTTYYNVFTAGARFVKCDKCGHFFVFNETVTQPKEEAPPSRPLPTPKEVI